VTRGAAPGLAFLLTAVSAIAGPAAVERDVAGEVGASAVYVTSIEAPKIVAQRFDPAGKERPRVEIELRGSVVSETVCPFERLVIEKTAIAVSDWEESWELAVKPVTLGDVSLTSKACPATLTVREFTARLVLEPSLWRKEVPGRTYRYRIQTGGRERSFAVLLDREAGWSLEVHGDEVHASARPSGRHGGCCDPPAEGTTP
jgi:hypothetical protein